MPVRAYEESLAYLIHSLVLGDTGIIVIVTRCMELRIEMRCILRQLEHRFSFFRIWTNTIWKKVRRVCLAIHIASLIDYELDVF